MKKTLLFEKFDERQLSATSGRQRRIKLVVKSHLCDFGRRFYYKDNDDTRCRSSDRV